MLMGIPVRPRVEQVMVATPCHTVLHHRAAHKRERHAGSNKSMGYTATVLGETKEMLV